MKYLFLIITLFVVSALNAQYVADCGATPDLNKQVLKVLEPYKGKKIGRGECWDAAKLALDKVNAEWNGLYSYGREIDPKKECVYPGDIIQFENVKVEIRTEKMITLEDYSHHTAIIYAVSAPGEFELFHQNAGYTGRKMGISPLALKNVKKGTIKVYRPVAAAS